MLMVTNTNTTQQCEILVSILWATLPARLSQVMHNTVDADLLKKDLEAKLQRLVQEDLRIVPAWELAEYADG